jgi:hypothetical protein
MKKVFFNPWVGKNYKNNGGIFKKKILALGDSHYCGECNYCGDLSINKIDCREMTSDVINYFLDQTQTAKWKKTFTCFERAVSGKALMLKEKNEFWNSLIFYNYVQNATMCDPNTPPTEEMYKKSEVAFWEILQKFEPDYILIWGKRLYDYLPNDTPFGKGKLKDIEINGSIDFGAIWYVPIKNKTIIAYRIPHPGRPFSWEEWHPFIKKALNLKPPVLLKR